MAQPTNAGEANLSQDSLACAQLLQRLLRQLEPTVNSNKRPWSAMDEGSLSSLRQPLSTQPQQHHQREVRPETVVTSVTAVPDEGLPKKKPQTRASLACHECRYRKVRCDGQKPVCGSCQARGRSHTCSYTLSLEKEKKRDVFGYASAPLRPMADAY